MLRCVLQAFTLILCTTVMAAEPVGSLPAASDSAVPTQEPPWAWKKVLLLPYFDNEPHFDYGRDVVTKAIVEVYRKKRVEVTRVEESEYARQWQEVVNNIDGIFRRGKQQLDVEAAAFVLTFFARRLGPGHPYDGILIPTLGYRIAKVDSYYAQWDGVKRKIKFKRRPGGTTEGWGIVTGISLSLVGMNRSLTGKISESMGGLVLPFEYDWIDKSDKSLPVTEIFADYGDVKGGVEIAVEQLMENSDQTYTMRFVPEL